MKKISQHNVPNDLWPDILSRLPVKSVLRFRCVSKSWKVFIDNPTFSRLHLTNFNNSRQPDFFFVQGIYSRECVVKNHKTLITDSILGFLQSHLDSPINALTTTPTTEKTIRSVRPWYIVSSIDGLFMLESMDGLMLWNPSIRKILTLPPSPDPPLNAMYVNFGLGFDPLIMDYKCVRFALKGNRKGDMQFLAVYTLGTDSWKAVEYQGERQDFVLRFREKRSISFRGVVYAISTSPLKLVSFDLRTELFASFELPPTDEPMYHHAFSVVEYGCSPGLIGFSDSKVYIWQLEGDDVTSCSWIQRCIIRRPAPFHPNSPMSFLCLKKNGEMLLKCEKRVMFYNLETHHKTMILMRNNNKWIEERSTVEYIESLILHTKYDRTRALLW